MNGDNAEGRKDDTHGIPCAAVPVNKQYAHACQFLVQLIQQIGGVVRGDGSHDKNLTRLRFSEQAARIFLFSFSVSGG
jgi:hypothetical protein